MDINSILSLILVCFYIYIIFMYIDVKIAKSHITNKYSRFNYHLSKIDSLVGNEKEAAYWLITNYAYAAQFYKTDKEVSEHMGRLIKILMEQQNDK